MMSECTKSRTRILLLISLLLILMPTVFAEDILPANPDPNVYRVGEDGTVSLRRPWEDPTGWLLGKIHPDVTAVEPVENKLEIKIQLTNQPLAKIAKQVRKRKQKEIELFENELKSLVVESIADLSYVSRDDEVEAVSEETIEPQTREHMKVLHQEIDRINSETADEIVTAVIASVNPDQQIVLDLIAQLGGQVTSTSKMANIIGVTFFEWDEATLIALAQNPLVQSITLDYKMEFDLDESACMLGADSFWNAGLDGGIWDLGMCDSGVRDTHIYLNTHDIYKRYPAEVDSHGTSVAGIVGSTHATYQGIAFGIDKIINGKGHNSMSESTCFENQDWVIDTTQHGNDGPEVINNSYSLYGHTDEYGDFERYMDSIVDDLNISVTKSAGNRGPGYGGMEQLGYPQSHNLISVANLDINDTCTTTDDIITHIYSSRGPTDSGRRKPDITAPGTGTATTTSSSDTAMTTTFGGTSGAAPHAAAACLLLRDHGISSPMVQKAILLNTATTWSDGGTLSDYTDDGPVDGDRWDNSYGWGILDIGHAYTHRNDYFSSSVIGKNDTAADDDYKLFKGHMYFNDKVTMVWHRRAVFNDDQAPTTYYSLTDLNLRLYNESNGSLLDSDVDGNDNVHQVSADSSYDVVVKAYSWDTTISGAASEPFVLATEEGFTQADPPSFQRNYSRPNYVGPSQTFNVTVRIFNNGDVAAHSNTVTLTDISGFTVNGDNTHSLPSIEPGPYPANPQETVYSITTSGATAGTHWLPLDVESDCYLETYTYSTTNGVSLIVETDPPTTDCTSAQYAKDSPIAVNWTHSDSGSGIGSSYLYVKRPGDMDYSYTGLAGSGSSGSFDYTPTAGDGYYFFAIRGVDAGGNWEPIPTFNESYTFYDTVAPNSSVSSPATVAAGAITLTYSSSDPYPDSGVDLVYFYYKKGLDDNWHFIQNTTVENGTINWTPTGGSGTYYFSCKAKDKAGNLQYGGGYPPAPETRTIYGTPCDGDCNGDGSTNFTDLVSMGQSWLDSPCPAPMYCDGCDLDGSGKVDYVDFAELAENYLCTP